MKLRWKGRGCSCLVTYGKYLGAGGVFWEDERFLFAHHHTGNGFLFLFFTTFIITGKQSGSWFESIFLWGS